MRLWHKDLIPVLPRQQLLSQWRECCAIASNIAEKGTPNHLLVNKIMDYPMSDFHRYTRKVVSEMERRGYRCNYVKFIRYKAALGFSANDILLKEPIFEGWHNDRYLIQCLMNLQEKYDCGGITEEEWMKVSSIIKEVVR